MESVETLLAEFSETEAGKALEAKGFKAKHQGGGLVNFEAVRDGVLVTVVSGGYDFGPRLLAEAVDVMLCKADDPDAAPGDDGVMAYPNLGAYLDTLA